MKKEASKIYQFSARLERKIGVGAWFYVSVPFDVEKEFGKKSSVRVLGSYNNIPFDRALIPLGDGTHHIIISGEMRKKAGLKLGNTVNIQFHLNPNPDEIIVPEDLEEGFELEPLAREIFEKQTVGFKRGVIIWINQAKRPETKAKRVAEMLRRLTSGQFVFGGSVGKN